jgi:hypothetical protein
VSGDLPPGESVFHVREGTWLREGLGEGLDGHCREEGRGGAGESMGTPECGGLNLCEVSLSLVSLLTPGPPSAASLHSSTRQLLHPPVASS